MNNKRGISRFENLGVLSILVLAIFILLVSYNVSANDFTLCSSGCDYSDLQTAMNGIGNNDSIYINEEGGFSANGIFNINKTVQSSSVIIVNVSNVELSGFSINGNNSGYGIYAAGKDNITLRDISIQGFVRGISVETSVQSNFYNNTIDGNEYGLLLRNVDDSNIWNSFFDNNNYGINLIVGSNNNNVYNNMYNLNNYSIAIDSSDYCIFSNENIDSSLMFGIRFDTSNHNIVADSLISNSGLADVYAGGAASNNTLIETGYDQLAALNSDTYIYIKEEVEIQVNHSGTAVAGADVYIRDNSLVSTGDCMGGSCNTNSTGTTGRLNLTVYYRNNQTVNDLSPLNIYATNATHGKDYNWSDFSLDIIEIELQELDLTSPIVSNVDIHTTNTTVLIQWSTNENADSSIIFGTDNSTLLSTGVKEYDSSYVAEHAIEITGLNSNTTYYFNINSTDISGNHNDSYFGNFTTNETLDLSPPVISIIKPSSMQSFTNYEGVEFEIDVNEYVECNVTSYVGETFISKSTFTNITNNNSHFYRKYIPTVDSSGYDNYFKAECADTSGNSASKTVYFKIEDNVYPTANFVSPSPSNGKKTNITNFVVNITVSESMASGFPRYNFNNGTDESMSQYYSGTNSYYTFSQSGLSEGEYTYIIILRDNKGNEKNYSRTFEVDQTEPDIRIIYPEEDMSISSCAPDPFNISMKEKSDCSYILYYDDEQGTDTCKETCDEDRSDCLDDAYDEADEDSCEDDFDECEIDCEDDRFQSRKEADMEETYDPIQCKDDCEDTLDTCMDTCDDEEYTCLNNAYDPDSREYCEDERETCEDDCSEDEDSCKLDCEDDNLYVYTEEDTYCFGNGNFLIEYTCTDKASNTAIKNETFTITDQSVPIVTSSSPNGSVSYSPITIRVGTDERATCRIDDSDKEFEDLSNKMIGNDKAHSFTLLSLPIGNYTYYVKCNDTLGNVMKSSYLVEFDVIAAKETKNNNPTSTISNPTDKTSSLSKTFNLLVGGKETSFLIDSSEISINEIIIVSKTDKPNVVLEATKSNLKTGMISPDLNNVYEYFEIKKERITNSDIDKVVIKYKVAKSWLNDKKVTGDDITLLHYNEVIKEWQEIGSTKLSEDSNNIYYKSETDGLSLFVVGSKTDDIIEEPVQNEPVIDGNKTDNNDTEKDANEDNPEDVSKKSNWILWLIIGLCSLVVVGGGTAGFVLLKKHPQQNKVNSATTQLPSEKEGKDTEQIVDMNNGNGNGDNKDNQINQTNEKEGVVMMDTNTIANNVTKSDQSLNYVFNCISNNVPLNGIIDALENAGYSRENIMSLFDSMGLADDDVTKYINSSLSSGVDKLSLHRALSGSGYANEYIMEKFIALGVEQNEIINYVENTLKNGYEENQIMAVLSEQGYDQAYSSMLLSGVKAKIRREIFASKKDQNIFATRDRLVNESYNSVNQGYNYTQQNIRTNGNYNTKETYADNSASEQSYSRGYEPEVKRQSEQVVEQYNTEPSVSNKQEVKTEPKEKKLSEDIDIDLLDYAKASLKEGMSKYHLKKVMIKAGHDKESVKLHIDTAREQLREEGFKKGGFLGFFS